MEKNNEFNKLLYISYLIGKQKDIYWLFVLFWILKEENLCIGNFNFSFMSFFMFEFGFVIFKFGLFRFDFKK